MHRMLAYRSDRQMQKTVCQFIGHFPGHQLLQKKTAKPDSFVTFALPF